MNKDVKMLEEKYKAILNELNLGPGAETTNMVPSNTVNSVVALSDKEEECEDQMVTSNSSNESETDMAKNELYKIHNASKSLYELLKNTPNIEPWVFSKITVAASYLEGVKNYLEYNRFKEDGEFENKEHNHLHSVVSKLRDLLHGESKDTVENILRETLFHLETFKN